MTSAVLAGVSPCPLADGVLVVANPAAAGVTQDLSAEVEGRLREVCGDVELTWTRGAGHAGALAAAAVRAGGPGLLVALGGDGTVREMAEAVAGGSDEPGDGQRDGTPVLLTLPAGSGNSSSRNLWGDLGVADILDLVADPRATRVRRLDMLRLHEAGVTVLLGASSGFLAEVLIGARDVDSSLTGIHRYFAAAGAVLAAMPAHPTRVTVDGAVLHDGPACSVAVGGGRFRASAFQFLPRSVLDDGLLDVSTIGALDPADVAGLAQLVPTGDHVDRADVTYGRGRSVILERTDGEPLIAEYDGDVWNASGPRLTIDVVPGALPALASLEAPCG